MNIGLADLLKIAEISLVNTTYSGALVKSFEFIKISIGLIWSSCLIKLKVTNTEFLINALFSLYTFASTTSGLMLLGSDLYFGLATSETSLICAP